jgi:Carbohydrate esterase, sialic acid-specific acetylesterase
MTAIDVFLIAGQSNALGMGVAAQSPAVAPGQVLQVCGGTISDANDPVGSEGTGSAWPMFGIYYSSVTGRKVAFIPAAVGDSDQCAQTDLSTHSNWDASGSLWAASVTALNDGLKILTDADHAPSFCGVLWSQGENDGMGIHVGNITAEDYVRCLRAMIARYRNARIGGTIYPKMPFYISQTGADYYVDNGVNPCYGQIRAAQAAVAANDPYTIIGFADAHLFPTQGLMSPDSQGATLNYTQAGYNIMGLSMARALLAHAPGPAAAAPQPLILASPPRRERL